MRTTFSMNVISEDGGIPGFDLLAKEIFTLSVFSEFCACCNATKVSFLEDATWKIKHIKL